MSGAEKAPESFEDASRRTHFAEERTLLAWWRTGIATAAVAIGIGGLVPRLAGMPRARFVALGIAYGILAVTFVVGGLVRVRRSREALAHNTFAHVPMTALTAITAFIVVLILLSVLALL